MIPFAFILTALAFHSLAWAASERAELEGLGPIRVFGERPAGERASLASEFSGQHLEVDETGETSLARVLSRQPSVHVQTSGGEGAAVGVQLRGQDPVQNRFFLGLIPLTDAHYHTSPAAWFPVESLAGVDIFPEGTPATLGGDGLGGAIVLRPRPVGAGRGFILGRVGSFGSQRLAGRAVASGASVLLDVGGATDDFFYRDDGATPFIPEDDAWARRQNNGHWYLSAVPQVRLVHNASVKVETVGMHFLRRQQVPGPVGQKQEGKLEQDYHLVGLRAEGRPSSKSGGAEWEGVAYASVENQVFSTESSLAALQAGRRGATAWGGRGLFRHESGRWAVEAMGGVTAEQADSVNGLGEQWLAGRTVFPLGVSLRWEPLDGLRLLPSLAVQPVLFSGERSSSFLVLSPRLGVQHEWGGSQRLRASAGLFSRAPSLAELFGSPGVVSPNPALAPEHAWKLEAGWDALWRVQWGPVSQFRLSAGASAAFAQSLITLVPNSQYSFIARNIGHSRTFVEEVGAELLWGGHGWLSANAMLLQSENLTQAPAYWGKALPMRPAYRAGVELGWKHARWKAAYTLNAVGPLFADPANGQRVGSFWDHGVWVGYQSGSLGHWFLEMRNLADAVTVAGGQWGLAADQTTTGLAGFPAPGRRVYFTWRYEL